MFNEVTEKERERKLIDGGLDISGLENIKLVHREGNAVIRRHLESLPLETFDSVSYYILYPCWRNSNVPLISVTSLRYLVLLFLKSIVLVTKSTDY